VPRRPPVALAAALLLAGCQGGDSAVDVEPVRSLPAATSAVCEAVTRALPASIARGVTRRDVAPDRRTTAAWGDPPVVLRCGVDEGSERDDPYVFDGVRWAMHDVGAARRWTTRGRAVNVEVVVPDAYSGQAELLGSLATALRPTAR
jgi:hypothetical protein